MQCGQPFSGRKVFHGKDASGRGVKLERAKGFEPSAQNPQPVSNQPAREVASQGCTQIRAQILGELGPELSQVVTEWPSLSQPLKAAINATIRSAKESEASR